MLMVPTELRPSLIHGIGAFLLVPVKKGDLIWRFDSRIDRIYSQAEFEALPKIGAFLKMYAHWYEPLNLWMVCGDYGNFFNHSETPNTLSLSAVFGDDVAARDLAVGEELTSDYRTICDLTRTTGVL
jgi:SET domain-containing protein